MRWARAICTRPYFRVTRSRWSSRSGSPLEAAPGEPRSPPPAAALGQTTRGTGRGSRGRHTRVRQGGRPLFPFPLAVLFPGPRAIASMSSVADDLELVHGNDHRRDVVVAAAIVGPVDQA